MHLFVGLGNPGGKYSKNRHNAGYMAVEAIAENNGFGPWKRKFKGVVSEGRLGNGKVMLLKPETYMNDSGQSAGEAARYYKLSNENVVVFHDEIDLAPGKLRIKRGGGHAGHNGLRSLDAHIGANYMRIRIGVGRPGEKKLVRQYVLKDFSNADHEWLDDLLLGISNGAGNLVEGREDRFRNAISSGRVLQPKPATGKGGNTAGETGSEENLNAIQKLIRKYL
ncbi:MAG: aminoacyl-tRNA hydrolase [Roseovarius sp.]|nr:aminoacyl-tRNA hydrolase [Roseovarius sp.]